MAHNLHRDYEQGRDKFSAQLRQLHRARPQGSGGRLRPRRWPAAAPLNATLDEVFNEYDAILTPAAPGEAPVGEATGNPVFCTTWTYLGTPAVTLPLLRSEAGLPLGVQLVGRRGNDARLLRTANWLVKTLGQGAAKAAATGEDERSKPMTNLITGIIGIAMLIIFMGFMLVWVKAPPLIIICLIVFALADLRLLPVAARPARLDAIVVRQEKGRGEPAPFARFRPLPIRPRSAARRAAP